MNWIGKEAISLYFAAPDNVSTESMEVISRNTRAYSTHNVGFKSDSFWVSGRPYRCRP